MDKTKQMKKKDKKVNKDTKVQTTKTKKWKIKAKKLDDIRLQVKKPEKPLKICTTIKNQQSITSIINSISLSEDEQILLEEKVDYPINRNILDIFKQNICSLKRDLSLDTLLQVEYKNKNKNCKSLTIFEKRQEILDLIEQNSVVLIHGEPESGLTTQVPQFILDEFIKSGNGSLCKIVSTQPYKKNVIVAYKKVSEDRTKIFGNSAGISYQIRFDNHSSRKAASITYCTSGMLMKKISTSSYLNQITHLIIDEIQERDICTDFLLALFKQIISTRTNLKLILLCTSFIANKISKYFDKCPKINVSPDIFPVDEYYLEETLMLINFNNLKSYKQLEKDKLKNESKYPNVAINLVKKYEKLNDLNPCLIISILKFICSKTKEGSIVILVPSFPNLRLMETEINNNNFLNSRTQVVNVTDPEEEEEGINFNTNRKIFLACNERNLNLVANKIMFVIDAAKIRISFYDIITNRETVKNEWISKKTLKLRKNLAGRFKPGICFHLISEDTIQTLDKYPIPQILLADLEKIILEIKIFGIENAELFLKNCLTAPDGYCVQKTIEMFKNNDIFTDEEFLTPFGFHISKLPLKFCVGKMVILGAFFSCLDPILTIASCFGFSNIFQGKFEDIQKIKEHHCHISDDFLLIVYLLNKFTTSNQTEEEFLEEHFLRPYLIQDINNTTHQLKNRLMDMNFLPRKFDEKKFNINSKNTNLIKALLSIALYPNIALIRNHRSEDVKKVSMETVTDNPCFINGSSINYKRKVYFPSPIIMYKSSSQVKTLTLRDTSFVTPLQVLFFASNLKYSKVNEEECIIYVIGSLKINCSISTCEVIKNVQDNFNKWLEYKLKVPVYVDWEKESWDTRILRAVVKLLDNEI